MKQILLLLLAIYSLIINQSNKSFAPKKAVRPAIEVSSKPQPPPQIRQAVSSQNSNTLAFPLGLMLYTGYSPLFVKAMTK
jgi:hypothetical protein